MASGSRLVSGWLPGVLVALATALGLSVARAAQEPPPTVVVDMEVGGGGRIEVYANTTAVPPQSQRLELGVRKQYVLPVEASEITMLRLDPTDEASVRVRLFKVEVIADGRTIARYLPLDLIGWERSGFDPVIEDGALTFTPVTADPILVGHPSLTLPRLPPWTRAARAVTSESFITAASFALPLVAAFFGPVRQQAARLLLTGAVLAAVPLALQLSAGRWAAAPPSVEVAVSRAAFLNLSDGPGHAAIAAALAGCGSLALLAGWAQSRRERLQDAPQPHRPVRLATGTVVALLIAAIVAPDLPGVLSSLTTSAYLPHWDADNLTYWAYLVSHAYVPFKDFWYPYGGQYLFDLAWPSGPAIRWVFEWALYLTLLLGLWLAAPSRRLEATLGVCVLIAAERAGLVPSSTRYLLGVDVIVAYLALTATARPSLAGVLLALAVMTLGVVIEIVQVIYAIPGIAAAWLLDVAVARPQGRAEWRRALLPIAVLSACGLIVVAATAGVLLGAGQLRGVWDYYTTLAEAVAYGAFPTSFDDLGWQVGNPRLVTLWWPVLSAVLGVYERWQAVDAVDRRRALAMCAIGLLAVVVMQKHIVRPMETQLWTFPVAGLVIFAALLPPRIPMPSWIAVCISMGILAATFQARGQLPAVVDLFTDAVPRAVQSARLLTDPARTSLANGERFAESRFRDHPAERELVAALRHRLGRDPVILALTDSPVVYILTGQAAVWQSNMYNASPIGQQRKVVAWLAREVPDYVVLRPDRLSWDNVPLAVRVPHVVQAVVEHYVPELRVGPFEVLRRRAPEEPIALEPWRSWFGPTLNLGHLPALIAAHPRPRCDGGGACDRYVEVTVPAPAGPEQVVNVSWPGRELTFDVQFATETGRTKYVIPLDKLWFAPFMGTAPELTTGQPGSADAPVSVSFLPVAPASDRLY